MRNVFRSKPLRIVFGNETSVEVPADEFGVRQQRRMEGNVALHAANDKAVKRLTRLGNGVAAVLAMHDQLGDHRIIEHRNFTAVLHAGIDPYAIQILCVALPHGLWRWIKSHQASGGRQEVAKRIFGVDATLNSPTVTLHLILRKRQFLACCHTQLQLHQIKSGDALGDGMLHLQTGIHFQEIKILVLADHEFHRARILVINGLGQRHGLFAHGLAGRFADEWRRCFFDDFLVTALNGALTLVEVDHVAESITQHLDFDVARLLDELLDEHALIAKTVARFVAARLEAFCSLLVIESHTQTLPAAAGAGLDHDRIANTFGNFHGLFGRANRVVVTWNGADIGL